jgi:hypothetical protein
MRNGSPLSTSRHASANPAMSAGLISEDAIWPTKGTTDSASRMTT